jgi:hypothetical protein
MQIYFPIEISRALTEVVFAGGKLDAPVCRESKSAHARLISATPTAAGGCYLDLVFSLIKTI